MPPSSDPPAVPASEYRLEPGEVARRLGVDPARGLSPAEVAQRLTRHGPNKIREGKKRGLGQMILDQLTETTVLILLGAALISGLMGEPEDTVAILAIVLVNGVIGVVQEYRADQAVDALKSMAAPAARVRRDGEASSLPAGELVPGDVVLLEAGNVVPADLRVFESNSLRVDESALTGESVPVEKVRECLDVPDLPIGDRRNLAYKGTLTVYGRGVGLVVATGMATELGKIAGLLQSGEAGATPLQERLSAFGKQLAVVVLAICAAVFVFGVTRGEPAARMFLTAVSLAVAAIPEALPAVITVCLALGATRMAAVNALARRLAAVETLGSVTYICSDKTGTLTQNRMTVKALWVDGRLEEGDLAPVASPTPARARLLEAMALSNDASFDGPGGPAGDPTEIALLAGAAAAGLARRELEARMPRVAELPFDSDRKRMTTVHRSGEEFVSFTKGAPEAMLERCARQDLGAGLEPIDQARIHAAVEAMAAKGLRVLAIGARDWAHLPEVGETDSVAPGRAGCNLEAELTFLGLIGMIDPARPEAAGAVAIAKRAGIVPVMITGDHPVAARTIAEQLGISDGGPGRVITGAELARLDESGLAAQVETLRVYARVDPAQKTRIVEALQAKGHFVAMTGDGVNDAPSLRKANIGIAMGKGGTDVAREAASMVLLDDNFATIVGAVREGRRIYDNIRKFVRFALSGNSGEIWCLFLAPLFGLPIPLLPIHILWVNLVTDGLPGLAFAAEVEEGGVMARPPRPPDEGIFAHGMGRQVVWTGLLVGVICLATQGIYSAEAGLAWQTMVFTTLTGCQMAVALSVRREREPFWSGFFANPWLLGAVGLTTVLQLGAIYYPPMQKVLHTVPLDAAHLAASFLAGGLVLVALEIEKAFLRRRA